MSTQNSPASIPSPNECKHDTELHLILGNLRQHVCLARWSKDSKWDSPDTIFNHKKHEPKSQRCTSIKPVKWALRRIETGAAGAAVFDIIYMDDRIAAASPQGQPRRRNVILELNNFNTNHIF